MPDDRQVRLVRIVSMSVSVRLMVTMPSMIAASRVTVLEHAFDVHPQVVLALRDRLG